ncbi:MAG: hypothetical protein MJ151_04440, partial [Lachnospiraceae bacterium]|nr:hypothetical protein [Lachnospiraceae bacterium]
YRRRLISYDNIKYIKQKEKQDKAKDILIANILKSNIKVISMSIILISIAMFLMIYQYQKGLRISCLSIGQGDSFVLRNDDKKVYTIDGGSTSNTSNGEYILAPNLKANQVSVIEKAYISHIDADHVNAIQYVISRDEDIKVKEVVLPIVAKDNKKYNEFVRLCEKNNVKVTYLKRGDVDEINKDMCFYCVSPSDKVSVLNNDVNQSSMCIKLYYKDNTMLFTGDMGKEMESEILKDKVVSQNLQSDILKIAHHGSRTASSKKFIEKVNPKYAILSYGYKNSYNHPHKETMNTLRATKDLKIYNTVDSGEIDIYMDKNIKIREYLR